MIADPTVFTSRRLYSPVLPRETDDERAAESREIPPRAGRMDNAYARATHARA
ncbi:hypothetical protein AB7C87_14385 [Natrarchaeobius sp. A-rgal3]|uniref:hypothetical protein n=1 Tax=Natrarchaeobius versutus TaxID=1679078 RepID=UPI003510D033